MSAPARPRSSLNRRAQFGTRPVPPVPETIEDTGLSPEALADLVLKTLYVQGARTGQQLTDSIRLPFALIDDRLLDMQQRQFVEVRGAKGHGRGGYTFDLTGKGRDRAREAMDSNQYVGPAPVPLAKYREWVELQSIKGVSVSREGIEVGFSHLVLDPKFLEIMNEVQAQLQRGHFAPELRPRPLEGAGEVVVQGDDDEAHVLLVWCAAISRCWGETCRPS